MSHRTTCLPLARATVFCMRAAYYFNDFKSWAGSVMLGASKFGGHMLMSMNPKARSQTQKKRGCPDCESALVKRSSNSSHPLMASTYLVCKNPVCGATFTGTDEITHRLSPPSSPNPAILLPYTPSAIRRGVLAKLGLDTQESATPGAHV